MGKINLLSSLILCCSLTFGQNLSLDFSKRDMVIQEGDKRICFELDSDFKRKKTYNTLTYYWYQNGKIFTTVGNYDGMPLHGEYTCYYKNGNLAEKGKFKLGLKYGLWYKWSESGMLLKTTQLTSGKQNGLTSWYNSDNQKIKSAQYKMGQLNGQVLYYENNVVNKRERYRNGLKLPDRESTKASSKEDNKISNTRKDKGTPSAKQKHKTKKFSFKQLLFWKKDNNQLTD